MWIYSILNHKGIVEIIDIKFNPFGIIIPKAEMNLFNFIHKIHKGNRIRFCQEIANGISYFYQQKFQNIHHYSLSSMTILVFRKFGKAQLQICDFGITPKFNEKNLRFIAPEINNHQNLIEFDEKCVVYSFSMIMWEILNWKTLDLIEDFPTHDKVKEGWRPLIDEKFLLKENFDSVKKFDLMKKFIDLMKKCWDKDPQMRPNFQKIISDLYKIESLNDDDLKEDYF